MHVHKLSAVADKHKHMISHGTDGSKPLVCMCIASFMESAAWYLRLRAHPGAAVGVHIAEAMCVDARQ